MYCYKHTNASYVVINILIQFTVINILIMQVMLL